MPVERVGLSRAAQDGRPSRWTCQLLFLLVLGTTPPGSAQAQSLVLSAMELLARAGPAGSLVTVARGETVTLRSSVTVALENDLVIQGAGDATGSALDLRLHSSTTPVFSIGRPERPLTFAAVPVLQQRVGHAIAS